MGAVGLHSAAALLGPSNSRRCAALSAVLRHTRRDRHTDERPRPTRKARRSITRMRVAFAAHRTLPRYAFEMPARSHSAVKGLHGYRVKIPVSCLTRACLARHRVREMRDTTKATGRTRLISAPECGADGACKPETRFQYANARTGFEQVATEMFALMCTIANVSYRAINNVSVFDCGGTFATLEFAISRQTTRKVT
jgi:hypothetical protein